MRLANSTIALLSFAVFANSAACTLAAPLDDAYLATAAPEWDAIFEPQSTRGASGTAFKWLGGDVAGTVDLGRGRHVWVFGDTFIAKSDDDQPAKRKAMVSDSIALQTLSADRKPDRSQIEFLWGQPADDGALRPWIAPTIAADPDQHTGGWYWFTGGGALVRDGQSNAQLLLFLFHLDKKQDGAGVWAFESVGGALATIDNPQDDPSRWRTRQQRIPFAWGADTASKDQRRPETSWGVAAFREPAETNAGADMLFVFGVRTHSSLDKQLLLARVPAEAAEQFDAWRFFAGSGVWSSDPHDAVPIAKDVTSELSVEAVERAGQRQFILVHSQPPLERRILVRTAAHPQGPWTEPIAVYSAPDVERDKTYFAYAAKGHASLSADGELLISYMVNSHDFKAAQRDLGIYRPRFVRVPLETLFPAVTESPQAQ